MACAVPSAGDLQAYRIVDRATPMSAGRRRSRPTIGFIAEGAPVCHQVLRDPVRSRRVRRTRRTPVRVAGHDDRRRLHFAALIVAAGMGSGVIGYFDDQAVRDLLGLDPAPQPVALMTVGWAELPVPTPRRLASRQLPLRPPAAAATPSGCARRGSSRAPARSASPDRTLHHRAHHRIHGERPRGSRSARAADSPASAREPRPPSCRAHRRRDSSDSAPRTASPCWRPARHRRSAPAAAAAKRVIDGEQRLRRP